MKRLLIGALLTAFVFGALPAPAGHCASSQTALHTSPCCCCASSVEDTCVMACTQQTSNPQHELRAATTEPILKTFFNTIAYYELTAPALMLASAGSPTHLSPAPIPRRYLRLCTLRL